RAVRGSAPRRARHEVAVMESAQREPKASYGRGGVHDPIGEKVELVTQGASGKTVVTVRGRVRTTYLGVRHPTIAEGDMLEGPLAHVARTHRIDWNPFDEPGGDDE